MKRVTKKGGIVACRESASMTWYPQSQGLTKWYEVHMKVAGSKGSNPNSGNRIHAWAREAGFKDIKCSAGTWCFASEEDREYWGGIWEKRTSDSVFNKLAIEKGRSPRIVYSLFLQSQKVLGMMEYSPPPFA